MSQVRCVFKRAELNYVVGVLTSLLGGIAMYTERVVFVKYMSLNEVGFNSLFESCFLFISAFDIGVTTYLLNYLVSSLNTGRKEDEINALSVLRGYFRKALVVMSSLGLLTALFMPFLTHSSAGYETALFFLIYLIGQLSEYIFGVRVLYLTAREKSYLVSLFVQTGRIIRYLISIFVISRGGNYLLYIIVSAALTLLSYLLLNLKAGHDYPLLRDNKNRSSLKVEKIEKNLLGMTMHRVSIVFFRSFEPILVSILFGSAIEGIYSNYLLLTSFFLTPFWIFQSTVTPSIARVVINGDGESNYTLYRKVSYMNFLLSLFGSFMYMSFSKAYIVVSYGAEYLMGDNWNCIFTFLFFLSSLRTSSIVFRDAEGEYSVDWKKAVTEIISALILSVLLSHFLGLMGIPVGFIITYITIVLWREKKTVLTGPFFSSGWNFVAKETSLMALGLVMITLLWYLESYFSFPLCVFVSLFIYFAFILLFFIIDKDASNVIRKKEKG